MIIINAIFDDLLCDQNVATLQRSVVYMPTS